MKNLSNTEAELKKSVAYKKSVCTICSSSVKKSNPYKIYLSINTFQKYIFDMKDCKNTQKNEISHMI